MIPIHELLNRIRWDAEFAKGTFELGYYDRDHGACFNLDTFKIAYAFPVGHCIIERAHF